MKRSVFVLSIIVALAAGIAAAQDPVSCISPAGECKAAAPIYGPTFCPAGFAPSFEACPVVAPSATPVTAAKPKPIEAPRWVKWLLDIAATKWGKAVLLPVFLGPLLLQFVGLLKRLAPGLQGWKANIVAGLVALFETAAVVAADSRLEPLELSTVAMALAIFLAGIAGYKLAFSGAARLAQGKP